MSVTPLASATWTVKVCVAAEAPTVPLIVPVVELIERPDGSVPDTTDQVSGVVPPVSARVCE